MSDAIEIKGLRVLGTHGVLEQEKGEAQPFEIDLRVETALHPAALTDELADAVDYSHLVSEAARVVSTDRFALLETLAEKIAAALLADPRIDAVTVDVRKLRPPIALDVSTVGVSITRRRTH